jgi:hypothetical protein
MGAVTGQQSADEMIIQALAQEISRKGPERRALGLGKRLRRTARTILGFLERLVGFLS